MPTYAYACTECDHNFEIVQSFSEDSLTVCPECGGRLRKVFNSVGVVFKGSGFYRTDSRSDSSGKARSGGAGTNGTGSSEPAAASENGSGSSSKGSASAKGSTNGSSSSAAPASASSGSSAGSAAD